MGNRREARVKMVLPVRVWGVDGNGQLFNQLAHTLDISRNGARLGGIRGLLAAGDSVTVQYKQKKAQFKVTWVGRPGSVGERQLGLVSLEPDKYIWIEIPSEQYRDDFDPAKRSQQPAAKTVAAPPPSPPPPSPPPVSPPVEVEVQPPSAVVEPAAPAVAPAAPAVAPAAPAVVPAAPAVIPAAPELSLSQRLRQITAELNVLQEALKTEEVDPSALQEFREIVNLSRHNGWVLQQWIEQQKGAEHGFPLAVMLLRERIRLAAQLSASISADVAQGIHFEPDEMQRLQVATRDLFSLKRITAVAQPPMPSSPAQSSPAASGPAESGAVEAEVPPAAAESSAADMNWLEQELQGCDKDQPKGLNLIAEHMRLWTGADGAAIALHNGDGMVCQASVGLAPDVGVPLPEDSALIGDSLRTGLPATCRDTESDPRVDPDVCRSINLRSTVIVPVLREGAACGILQVFSSTPGVFQGHHTRLLQQIAQMVNEFCLFTHS